METAIDLFAGGGGLSEGAREAGLRTVWAGNHDKLACEWFEINHGIKPACQDLHQANWYEVPRHDICCAAPSCVGHTNARGKEQPRHDAARSTAWAVISCLEVHRPPFALVENVPEFLDWELFPAWSMGARALGYAVSPHIIDAADHGVPQHRVRAFLVLSRSKAPMVLDLEKEPHVPVSTVLDWDGYKWNPLYRKGRSEATIRRAERGLREVGPRFAMPFYGSGSGETGRSLDRPIGTVTTRDRWALADFTGERPVIRMMQPGEYAGAMSLRRDYRLPKVRAQAIHLMGNMVCPRVATKIIRAMRRAA